MEEPTKTEILRILVDEAIELIQSGNIRDALLVLQEIQMRLKGEK